MAQHADPKDQVLVTKEGLQKLIDELAYLRKDRRKELAERLREAISYGDLSENAEYEQAKSEQAFIEGRITELEQMIKHAAIITEAKGGVTVQIGSKVKVKNITDNETETYTIVGTTETDPLAGKISNESPVGAILLGKRVGEELKLTVPAGEVKLKIVSID